MPIVALNGVSRFYGAVQIFSGVSLGIERGDRLALVGACASAICPRKPASAPTAPCARLC